MMESDLEVGIRGAFRAFDPFKDRTDLCPSQFHGLAWVRRKEQVGQFTFEGLYCPVAGDFAAQVSADAVGHNADGDRIGF